MCIKKIPCVFGVLKTEKGMIIKDNILSYLNERCDVLCIEQEPPGILFEYPALKYTLKMAIDLNCPVLYLHTKGAVDPNHSWYQEYVRKLWKVEFGTDKIFESYNKIISETPKIICPIAGKDGRQTWWNGFIINPAAAKELTKTFHYDRNRYYYEEMCKYAPSIELISSAVEGCYNEKETNILLKQIVDNYNV